jgi:hypothetical protein
MVLSSAAMVTAAETVQGAGRRAKTREKMGRVEKSWKKIGAVPDGTRIYFCAHPALPRRAFPCRRLVARFIRAPESCACGWRDVASYVSTKCDSVSACPFGGNAARDLYLRFALTLSKESGASYFAQAYIPTQPAQAIEDTRISRAHEDPGRQESYFPPSRQGAQAGLGKTRFPRIVQRRGEESRVPTRCCARHVARVTWK